MYHQLLKSVHDADSAPIVICDLSSTVVYMNPAAIARYHADLTGKSVLDCHSPAARARIAQVLAFFAASVDHNRVYTFRNDQENKDVYMVALRDENGTLIGYYEKHEYRNCEKSPLYDMPD